MKAFAGVVALSFTMLMGNITTALAADKGSADEAVAMVGKAAALIKSDGKE